MRFLLDANLPPGLIGPLAEARHSAVHVADLSLLNASDDEILRRADDDYTVITADSDFPTMLALRRASAPSVVHLRYINDLTPHNQAALLVANLPTVLDDLGDCAIVPLSPTRMAVRRLPIA